MILNEKINLNDYLDRKEIAKQCNVKIRRTYDFSDDGRLPLPDAINNRTYYWLKTNKDVVNLIESYKHDNK